MAGFKPLQFIDEVRREVKKVSWPTLNETRTTTIMVLFMVAVSSVFLFTVDWGIAWIINFVLGIKG